MKARSPPERLKRVRELFGKLSELKPEERNRFLKKSLAEDNTLRTELEELCAQSDSAEMDFNRLEQHMIQPFLESVRKDPFIGQTISHYEVVAPLGNGGMGLVYEARDLILGRYVALKFLPLSLADDAATKQRFIKEAQTASALDHPNVANIHDIGETADGQLYLAMAFYPGESLKDRIARGPLGRDIALDYAIQIATGLAAAHRQGVIHRDIKPGNIQITCNNTLKILDFGLSEFAGFSSRTSAGQLAGTVAYMSPEQARGQPVDTRTDIWSTGAVLYEMLTGKKPFCGESPQTVIQGILKTRPTGLVQRTRSIPNALRPIIRKCLEKDPQKRYASMEALLADLQNVRIAEVRDAPSGWRFHRSRSRLRMVGVSVLVGIILAGGIRILWRPPVSTAPEERRSIAVLPMQNLSPDPENSFFANGFHEDILANLAGIRSLRVISRTSVMDYADRSVNLRTIANELGVRYIVEGSVRREQNVVRITARLIDAGTDEQLWAGTYDRALVGIFQIQTEVAMAIAKALETELTSEEKRRLSDFPTRNIQAYDAFAQARNLLINEPARRLAANYDAIVAGFNRAVELDPGFLAAWSYLAQAHSWAAFQQKAGLLVGDPVAMSRLAREAVNRCLRIDSNHPLTRLAAATCTYYLDLDYLAAAAQFQKVIDEQPSNFRAHFLKGLALEKSEHFEEALSAMESAWVLSPRTKSLLLSLARSYWWSGRIPEAISAHERILEIDPEETESRSLISWYRFTLSGNPKDFQPIVEMVKSGELAPVDWFVTVEGILAMAGEWEALKNLLDSFNIETIRSPHYREYARRRAWFRRVMMAQAEGDPARVKMVAQQGLTETYTSKLDKTHGVLERVSVLTSGIRMYAAMGDMDKAWEIHRQLAGLDGDSKGMPPFDRQTIRFQLIQSFAELNPDEAVSLLIEMDASPTAYHRIREILAFPWWLPGIFNSPRMQQIARTYDGGQWIPYLTKHGFIK